MFPVNSPTWTEVLELKHFRKEINLFARIDHWEAAKGAYRWRIRATYNETIRRFRITCCNQLFCIQFHNELYPSEVISPPYDALRYSWKEALNNQSVIMRHYTWRNNITLNSSTGVLRKVVAKPSDPMHEKAICMLIESIWRFSICLVIGDSLVCWCYWVAR